MSQKSDASTRPATLAEGLGTLDSGAKLAANQLLGPYRLVRQLGEGGMGVVWLADQLQPFERKVAIKLSTRQSSSGPANAYFEIERQALAQLVHPYIAQIYDAGVRSDGTLYFAMEYVEGSTLDEFLVDKPISIDACIALLAQICQGAHYAHQRGLIHRDLKPGNVLVAQVSGSPMPKIIDFGIAIGVDTARSGSSASAGTRAYMAPEQFSAHMGGIDLRVDVYALGAILIETLCLQLKIPLNGVDSGTFRGLLSAAGTSADAVKHTKHVPASLRGELRRIPKALRSIAIKAMAEDREQRYESAAAMADDLKRWRERRPVLAMQGGKLYAMRCFVNRYRLASALGAATLTALVVGLIVASYGLQQAKIARAQAEIRREQAESLVDYMLGDFAAKLEPIGKLDLIDGVATRALEYLQQANDSDLSSAIHRAAALRTIGDVQTRRGQWPQAKSTFALADAALSKAEQANPGPMSAELLFERGQVAYWIGYTYYNERDYLTAKIHWQRYLGLAERLVQLTEESGLGLVETAYALSNIGTLAFETGEIEYAKNQFLRTVAIRKNLIEQNGGSEKLFLDLSHSFSWLGKTHEKTGDIVSALQSYREQLLILEKTKDISPDDVNLRANSLFARHWIALLELQTGEILKSTQNLRMVISGLTGLVKIDTAQSNWTRILAVAQSDLAFNLYLLKDYKNAGFFVDSALFRKNNSSENLLIEKRAHAIAQFRKALLLTSVGKLDESLALFYRAQLALDELLQESPQDRRTILALVQCLIANEQSTELTSNLLRAKTLLEPLVEKQVDASTMDAIVRVKVLMGDVQNAHVYKEKLRKIFYNHPEYKAFLARHPKGL